MCCLLSMHSGVPGLLRIQSVCTTWVELNRRAGSCSKWCGFCLVAVGASDALFKVAWFEVLVGLLLDEHAHSVSVYSSHYSCKSCVAGGWLLSLGTCSGGEVQWHCSLLECGDHATLCACWPLKAYSSGRWLCSCVL